MKIIERIALVQAALIAQGTQTTLHGKMTNAAINAVRGGITSTDWSKYMTLFADNEQQLKRLTGQDEVSQQEGYVKVSSAYLVANGTCGGFTPAGLHQFIDARIDEGLPSEPDGTITRIFDI